MKKALWEALRWAGRWTWPALWNMRCSECGRVHIYHYRKCPPDSYRGDV